MKKFTVILLVLFLLSMSVIFAAGQQPASEDKIIIDIFSDLWPEVMEKALVEAGLEGVVEFRLVPQNQYEPKLKMMIAGGTVGDILAIDAPNIAYYANIGALEPLDSYWDKDDFEDLIPASQGSMTWNDKIWASPLNESNCVLYYNKEMFKEAGITTPEKLEDAWDLGQLLEASRKLTKKDANGNTVTYGIMPQMFSPDNTNEGMSYTQMLWTWWFGADIISPDGTTVKGYFDSPENRQALQYYSDLHNKYKVAPAEAMTSHFEAGKTAMWITGPWMVSGVWPANFPDFMDKWGAMPLPHGVAAASNSGSWNLAITSQSENKELAWKVIQVITGKEGMAIYCNETGNLPARKSVIDNFDMSSSPYNIISEQLKETARNRPVTPVYPAVSMALWECYNAIAFGEDVDTAMAEAVEKMERALQSVK